MKYNKYCFIYITCFNIPMLSIVLILLLLPFCNKVAKTEAQESYLFSKLFSNNEQLCACHQFGCGFKTMLLSGNDSLLTRGLLFEALFELWVCVGICALCVFIYEYSLHSLTLNPPTLRSNSIPALFSRLPFITDIWNFLSYISMYP